VLLKTLAVNVPQAMLAEQARRGPTAASRLLAVETIGKEPRTADIKTCDQVLTDESEFWAVRQSAARRLGRMQSDEALQALLNAERSGITNQRVLSAVIEGLGTFVVSQEAHGTVLKHADRQQPLSVETAAIRALGQMRASPELIARGQKAALEAARKPSRRAVRYAAFASLRALEDPNAYSAVLELAQPARDDELRGQAVSVLGRLGRREEVREQTRTILTAWLYDPDRAAQIAAIGALGELGDPRSLADLERMRGSARGEDVRKAAESALDAVKRPEDPKRADGGLIDRLDTLEKQNQEMEKKFKALTDRLDATSKGRSPAKKTGAKNEKK